MKLDTRDMKKTTSRYIIIRLSKISKREDPKIIQTNGDVLHTEKKQKNDNRLLMANQAIQKTVKQLLRELKEKSNPINIECYT